MKLITAVIKGDKLDDVVRAAGLVVNDEVVDALVESIAKSANAGTIGDGKIWICDVEHAPRVRTGQRDRDAL